MGVLDSLLRHKEMERQQELADINQIGNSVANFLTMKRQTETDELNKMNILSQIEARKPTELDNLIKQGKAVDAAVSIGDMDLVDQLRGKSPFNAINKSLDPIAQLPENTANILDEFVTGPSQVSTPQVGDFIAEELDRFGNPTGFKRQKPSAAQEKRDVENNELAGQAKVAIDLFNQARKETSDISNLGASGIPGRIAGVEANFKAAIGNSPALKVFNDNVGKFATLEAKASGEQRPTDQDIVRFVKPLLSIGGSDEENAIKLATQLKQLEAKDVNTSWAIPLIKEFEKTTGVSVDFGKEGSEEVDLSKLSDEELKKMIGGE